MYIKLQQLTDLGLVISIIVSILEVRLLWDVKDFLYANHYFNRLKGSRVNVGSD